MASSHSEPVLVVGGCGFLGQNIIRELLKQDPSASISVLDLQISDHIKSTNPGVSYHQADITQKSQVAAVFAQVKPKVVHHTVSPHPLQRNYQLLHNVNVEGTRNLIASAQEAGTAVFVYTSSASVIHDHYSPLFDADESLPLLFSPQQPEQYAHTKALAEKHVLESNRVGGLLTAAIRPTTIYGEGDRLVTANLCRNAYLGRARNQMGNGQNLTDVTYVGNVAYAHILAAQALLKASSSPSAQPLPKDERVEGEAFFVRNEERYPFWEFNRMAARIAGYPVRPEDVRAIPLWLVKPLAFLSEWFYWIFTLGTKQPLLTSRVVRLVTIDRTFSIDKIRKRLGYRAPVTTEQGLDRAVRWYMTEVFQREKKAQ